MWDRVILKENGKRAFQANYGNSVLAVLALIAVSGIGSPLGPLFAIFVLYPLQVGVRHYFLVNSYYPAEPDEITFGFHHDYGNTVLTMLLTNLFLWLWTLLFFPIGFVKAQSYRLVPYILADNPGIGATEAITLSREMMDGHKWDAFVFDLSFIGWYLLNFLTLGILGILYVYPYHYAADAELYKAIRDTTFTTGNPSEDNPY